MRHLMIAAVLLGTGLLAGCGNDSNSSGYSNNPSSPNTNGKDSFIQSTEDVIATPNADTATAFNIDNIVETSPETTEPVAVSF